MKKKKINFKNFEIIKEGQIKITGGVEQHPSTTWDPNKPVNQLLPQACDNLGGQG